MTLTELKARAYATQRALEAAETEMHAAAETWKLATAADWRTRERLDAARKVLGTARREHEEAQAAYDVNFQPQPVDRELLEQADNRYPGAY